MSIETSKFLKLKYIIGQHNFLNLKMPALVRLLKSSRVELSLHLNGDCFKCCLNTAVNPREHKWCDQSLPRCGRCPVGYCKHRRWIYLPLPSEFCGNTRRKEKKIFSIILSLSWSSNKPSAMFYTPRNVISDFKTRLQLTTTTNLPTAPRRLL